MDKDLKTLSFDFAMKSNSEALFTVFIEVANGNNYVTKIAHSLKKSKAIVSRQIKQLVKIRLVREWGEGIKQTLSADWEVFTYYWISTFSPTISVYDVISESTQEILSKANVPSWMANLYFSPKEWKSVDPHVKGKISPEDVLEETLIPIIPELAPMVEILVKATVTDSNKEEPVQDFTDAFRMLSRSFAIGLPEPKELHPKLDEIKDERTKRLLKALYSDEVRLWLKVNVFCDIYAANIVRNMVLEKLLLIKHET
jgi:predicted transcriptional regulator